MGVNTGVKYIGKEAVYQDNILRTGLVWEQGETHSLPVTMAKEFLKHPSVFQEVPGFEYVSARSSGSGNALQRSGFADINSPTHQRITPLRCALFGDSTASAGTSFFDTENVTATWPASGATTVSYQFEKFPVALFYPAAQLIANCGITGETTTQMLARDSAAASATRKAITDVIDQQPHVIFLSGGSINNLMGITASQVDASVAATYAEHVQIINRLLQAGVPVIDRGIFGYSAAGATDPAATRAALVKLNGLFKSYATSVPGRVFFLDLVGTISDSNGNFLPGLSTDGIHLNGLGGLALGQAEAALLSRLFGASAKARFLGKNLTTNALLHASSAVTEGVVGTGYSIQATNATKQNAKVEVIDGVPFQTCEFTATSAGATGEIRMPWSFTTLSIAANDKIGFEFDYFLQSIAGAPVPAPTNFYARVDMQKTANGRFIVELTQASAQFIADQILHCAFGPLTFSEANTVLGNVTILVLRFTTDTVGGQWKLGVSNPRIVKVG